MNLKHQVFVAVSVVVVLLLNSCSTTGKGVSKQAKVSENFVKNPSSWVAGVDEYGSTFDTGSVFVSDSSVNVSFTIAKKVKEEEWPYVELICNVGGDCAGTKQLELTYRCTKPLAVKFSQSDFGSKGNETYSHYQYVAPAATEWNTVSIPVTDFAQPDWTPPESKNIPLKLENVDAIYFSPELDYEVGESADLRIGALRLHE